MSDRNALLNAILEAPDDDAPRLIMADWLDDHNEPERAEFIRLQIELANTPHQPPCKGDVHAAGGFGLRCSCVVSNLRKRADRLLDTHIIIDERGPLQPRCLWAIGALGKVNKWEFHRGFVDSITCSATDAITHLDAILATQPVREVTLTTPLHVMRRNDWEPPFYLTTYATPARYPYQMPESIKGWEAIREVNGKLPDKWEEMNFVDACLNAEWPRIKKWNLPLETPEFPNSADTLARRAQPHPMFPLRGSVRRV